MSKTGLPLISRFVIAVVLAFMLAAQLGNAQPATITPDEIAKIIAGPDRSEADRTNDLRRKPEQMLAFIGIQPGIVAPVAPPNTPPPSPVALAQRNDNLTKAGIKAAPIVAVVRPFEDPFPPEIAMNAVELVTLMFNYHDLGHLGVERAAMNKAVFNALKPGGVFVIADHSGRPGTGISEAGTLHRIEEVFLRQEVEAAGFRLVAFGDFLRNPNDPRDRNTPDPPQPKDEFVLKFVKP